MSRRCLRGPDLTHIRRRSRVRLRRSIGRQHYQSAPSRRVGWTWMSGMGKRSAGHRLPSYRTVEQLGRAGCASGNRSGAPHRLRSGTRMKPMNSQANAQMPESQTTTLLPADAFAHVPMLAGKILEPEKSMFRISRDTFREWDRRAQEAGYGENWRRSHEEREETRSRALAGRLDRDLWIFAYGSLMCPAPIHPSQYGGRAWQLSRIR